MRAASKKGRGQTAQALIAAMKNERLAAERLCRCNAALEREILSGSLSDLDSAVGALGEARRSLATAMCGRHEAASLFTRRIDAGFPEGSLPLSALLGAATGDERTALRDIGRDLDRLHRQAAEQSAGNSALIECRLEYIQFSIDALTAVALKPTAYGAARMSMAAPTFYVDQRA